MSLTGALSNAVSGLTASARTAGLVSSNIANALTESYGRRELLTSADSASTYGGVRIDGVLRHVDPVVLADRRLAEARLGGSEVKFGSSQRIENQFGIVGESGSLTDIVNRFEASLIRAAGDPSSTLRLNNVAQSGQELAQAFNRISAGLQEERMRADDRIAAHVAALNVTLEQIEDVNARISTALHIGRDPSALQDQRQRLIDTITDLVPVRVIPRDRGAVALYTTGGAVLLDGRAAEVGFDGAGIIVPEMTIEGGLLFGLTLNGRPLPTDIDGPMAGGRLGAEFQLRDDTTVAAQARLDALARDLIERFGSGGPDASIAVGDPGLFTDNGTAFQPANEQGLSARLKLSAAVSPGGSENWRLRDGLYSSAPGNAGDATLLTALHTRLQSPDVANSTILSGRAGSFAQHVAGVVSEQSRIRLTDENEQSFVAAQHLAMQELELSIGVDTDQELQTLMTVEQIYQANARVVTVVDDLMQTILNI